MKTVLLIFQRHTSDLCKVHFSFCQIYPWLFVSSALWLTALLAVAHWFTGSLFSLPGHDMFLASWSAGFMAFWISRFLVPRPQWLCFALAGSAFCGSLFAQNELSFFSGIDVTVVAAVFL